MKNPLRSLTVAVGSVVALASLSSAQVVMFNLDFVPEAGVTTSAIGSGTAELNTDTNLFSWNFSFSGLTSGLSNAHFHGPATTEGTAGVLVPIPHTTGVTSGTLIGSATVSDIIEGHLLDHLTYANLHTASDPDPNIGYPSGEIRGQVVPEPGTYALFAGLAALGGVFFWRRRSRR